MHKAIWVVWLSMPVQKMQTSQLFCINCLSKSKIQMFTVHDCTNYSASVYHIKHWKLLFSLSFPVHGGLGGAIVNEVIKIRIHLIHIYTLYNMLYSYLRFVTGVSSPLIILVSICYWYSGSLPGLEWHRQMVRWTAFCAFSITELTVVK